MKNRIKISVDGKSFTLMGEETESHMQAVAEYIHEKITEVRRNAAAVKMDASLAYVLTAINVADDYYKEMEKNAELEGRNLGLTTRLKEMVSQLDDAKAEIAELKAKQAMLEAYGAEDERKSQPTAKNKEEQLEVVQSIIINKEETVDDGVGHNHYPMGLKGGQAEKNMTRKAIRDKYRKK
ncbi:cell division protein ZapA [Anaerotignum sp.]|uniref:cell division protein ZapA n=1 Tax=Anaerotignum sp. TaxID=2039241 RepID=UPI0027144AC8|nr:cell division protein ZapA [Anaerotignum sp.]